MPGPTIKRGPTLDHSEIMKDGALAGVMKQVRKRGVPGELSRLREWKWKFGRVTAIGHAIDRRDRIGKNLSRALLAHTLSLLAPVDLPRYVIHNVHRMLKRRVEEPINPAPLPRLLSVADLAGILGISARQAKKIATAEIGPKLGGLAMTDPIRVFPWALAAYINIPDPATCPICRRVWTKKDGRRSPPFN